MIGAFAVEMNTGGPEIWGLSRNSLTQGRWSTIASYAMAHANLIHLWLNCSALLGLTVSARPILGVGITSWGRYFGLLLAAGLASGVTYLLLHPADGLPMVGASGAICGLWGLIVRCDLKTKEVHALRSKAVWHGVRSFALNNAILFSLIFVLVRLSGEVGGLAWEGHLGGFLLGLLIAPWIVVPATFSLAEPASTS